MPEQDSRYEGRKKTLLPAKIQFNNKQSVFDCTLRELSSAGARLEMASTLGVPDTFSLELPTLGESHVCRIVWSNMQELGVSFELMSPKGTPDLKVVGGKPIGD